MKSRRLRQGVWAVVLLALSGISAATEQIPDRIRIAGQDYVLPAEPLAPVLNDAATWRRLTNALGPAMGTCTANWRGYMARWSVREDMLYLESMVAHACRQPEEPLAIDALFPGQQGPLAASWFSGDLAVAQGEPGTNVHMGYSTTYPRYLLLRVDAGRITGRHLVTHDELMRRHDEARARPRTP